MTSEGYQQDTWIPDQTTRQRNAILYRQGQEDKNSTNKNENYLTKQDPSRYLWTPGWRVAKGHNRISF